MSSPPDPTDFSTTIDNPYFTLRPGTTFTYRDFGEHLVDKFVVTRDTKVVDGVTCLVVHDSSYIDGQLIEDTLDYFAQDQDGNVWYFGEFSQTFDPGNPDPISTEGSWQAGVDGATPGIIMEAEPRVGDRYMQEHAKGVAQDFAIVLSRNITSPPTVYGSFDHALETRDSTLLDLTDVEHKFYVAGIGNVLTIADGEYEQLVRITLTGTSNDDHLLGYAGGDIISGQQGRDIEHGWLGNDTLQGGLGDDLLIGGAGNDHLTGGAGADTFQFAIRDHASHEIDVITDYSKVQGDLISLPEGAGSVDHDSRDAHNIWQLTLDDGHVIKLLGVVDANHNGHITDDILFAG